nr:C40 family peptidase [Lachnospiraceae bacterium]
MKRKVLCLALCSILAFEIVVPVWATTISGVKNQRNQTQQSLNEVNSTISDIESQRETAQSELDIMNNQLVDILTSIDILEEEIELKQKEIDFADADLVKATELETVQYENMKKRIKFMYEQGDSAYMQALFGAINYSDMMNKAEYIEQIYTYDRELLAEYVENREKIEELKKTLVEERSAMKTAEYELEEEKESLALLVTIKRKTVEDFDSQLESARKKAAAYKTQLKQQNEKIKQMEEEKKRKEEEERKKKEEEEKENSDSEDGDNSENSDDSENEDESDEDVTTLGQQICDYACQFVGNPYVYGGTSLTNGTDCSGFTQSVYAHFGISIPRDSFSQRSCGVAVAYEDAQPGDIICYAGHVALYLGNGEIVHASTESTGITYGYATYRTILAVRRVI